MFCIICNRLGVLTYMVLTRVLFMGQPCVKYYCDKCQRVNTGSYGGADVSEDWSRKKKVKYKKLMRELTGKDYDLI